MEESRRGGLDTQKARKKIIDSWAMYDWANSAFATTIMAAMYPVFFKTLAKSSGLSDATATAYWGYTTAAALLIIAVLGPILGAISDCSGGKKRYLAFFAGMGILATGSMYFLDGVSWRLAAAVFILANIGFAGANIFYEALLPHLAGKGDLDRISARGYAFGYIGGGLLLAVNTLCVLKMSDTGLAVRLSFASVAVWWALFSIPLFRNVPDTSLAGILMGGRGRISGGLLRLRSTFHEIRKYRQLCLFLAAFLIYNDGIGTIIKMATAYGDGLGLRMGDLIGALLITQFVAFPATFAFGRLARRFTAKSLVLAGLGVYGVICVFGYFMQSATHFYMLAVAVGLVQGGTQALTRSLFAVMTPKHKSSEFFGFMSTTSKFAGIVGPFQMGLISQLTGSARLGILSILAFFLIGAALLSRVDVAEGSAVARAEEAGA